MIAARDGIWTWPLYGFDLSTFKLKDRLRRIAIEHGFQNVPDAAGLYAADIATSSLEGIECLKELGRLEGGGVAMYLDLDYQSHRKFLVNANILSNNHSV
jgi:hypothetical protein